MATHARQVTGCDLVMSLALGKTTSLLDMQAYEQSMGYCTARAGFVVNDTVLHNTVLHNTRIRHPDGSGQQLCCGGEQGSETAMNRAVNRAASSANEQGNEQAMNRQ
mmetsp:Transcript_15554/g.34848  ORF Transcript_15554/g.34848 Transcript_15554/m.34848 type:complete len:107 (+) Transcript_15554:372-692(+)